jgi:hypothetical protein
MVTRVDTTSSAGHDVAVALPASTTRGKSYPAVNPKTGKDEWTALVPKRVIDRAFRRGQGALCELDRSVGLVLRRPTGVYCGLVRDLDDDNGQTDGWYCYVGIPDRYDTTEPRIIPRGNRVLMVFLNKDMEVYTYRWEEEDSAELGRPKDRGPDRFKEELL